MALPDATQRGDPHRPEVSWGVADPPPPLLCYLCGESWAAPDYADHLVACEAGWYSACHRQGAALTAPPAPALEVVAWAAAGGRDREAAARYNAAAARAHKGGRAQPGGRPGAGDPHGQRRSATSEAFPPRPEAERDEASPGWAGNLTSDDAVVGAGLPAAGLFPEDEIPEDYEAFKKQLVLCPTCGRSFAADRLVVHQRSCKQTKKPVAKRPSGVGVLSAVEPPVPPPEVTEKDVLRSSSRTTAADKRAPPTSATVAASPRASLGPPQRPFTVVGSAFSSPPRRPATTPGPPAPEHRTQRNSRPNSLSSSSNHAAPAWSSATALHPPPAPDAVRKPADPRPAAADRGDRRPARQSGVRPEAGRPSAGATEPPSFSPKGSEGRSTLSLAQWMSSAAQELEYLQQQQQEYRNSCRSRQESRQLERGVMLRSRSRGPDIPSSLLGPESSPPPFRGRTEERHGGTQRRSHSAALPPEELDGSLGPGSPGSTHRPTLRHSPTLPRSGPRTVETASARPGGADGPRPLVAGPPFEGRARFCTQCGHQFDAPTMRFCPSCGTRRD